MRGRRRASPVPLKRLMTRLHSVLGQSRHDSLGFLRDFTVVLHDHLLSGHT